MEHPEVMHCSIQWSSIKKNTRYSIESCRSIIKFFSAYKVNASIEIIVSLARIDELWKKLFAEGLGQGFIKHTVSRD